MYKLSVLGLSLPITSAVLGYNLGFVSSAAAQEDALFAANLNLADVGTEESLARRDLDLSGLTLVPHTWMNLDWGLSLDKITKIQTLNLTPGDRQSNLKPNPFLTNHSPANLESLRVKADKTFSFNEDPTSVPEILSRSPDAATDNYNFLPVVTETLLIDNPINQTLSQIESYNQLDIARQPSTRVKKLQDVQTTDWAYEALSRLIQKYSCFAGYEDNTFKGDRPITRYEFAAALGKCLQKIQTVTTTNAPTEAEFAELKKLQAEFEQELNATKTRTDNLEQRIAFLEDHNFSPTTILRGQVVFQASRIFGEQKAVPSGEIPTEDIDEVTTFAARTRLNFETSFTGKDLLRTRIEAGNVNGLGSGVTGTQMTFLGVSTNTDNNVRLGQIFYRFPLGDKGNGYIAGARQSASAFIPTLNRASTISLFGFNNPLYDIGFGAGGGVYYQFTDTIGAGATYYSGSPDVPESGKGLFNGDYSALGQVTYTPSDSLGISFTYAHFFSPEPGATNNVTSFTGSQFAQLPFGENTATASDNLNLSFSYQISDRFEIGGWLGYISAEAKSSPTNSNLIGSSGAKADIWTGALTASYNDLGKLGSRLSFILGLPAKLSDNDISGREDEDTSLHLELSYNYPLTEKISFTPGILAITNPEHNDDNDTILVGLWQTTFSF